MKTVGVLKKQPSWSIYKHKETGVESHHLPWRANIEDYEKCKIPVLKGRVRINDDFSKGRSSVTFYVTCQDTGKRYSTTCSGFLEMAKISRDGFVEGLFTFKKQGSAVSLFPLAQDERWN